MLLEIDGQKKTRMGAGETKTRAFNGVGLGAWKHRSENGILGSSAPVGLAIRGPRALSLRALGRPLYPDVTVAILRQLARCHRPKKSRGRKQYRSSLASPFFKCLSSVLFCPLKLTT